MKVKNSSNLIRNVALIIVLSLIIAMIIFLLGSKREQEEDWGSVIAKYEKYMQSDELHSMFSYPEYLRYMYAKINDDEIPELLLAEGDGHADSIYIFTLNQSTGRIQLCGNYFTMGCMEYYEGKGVISGQIGGTGLWFKPYLYLNEGWESELMAASGINGNSGDFFWIEGDGEVVAGDILIDELFKSEYILPEDEFRKSEELFAKSLGVETEVDYEHMIPYTIDE